MSFEDMVAEVHAKVPYSFKVSFAKEKKKFDKIVLLLGFFLIVTHNWVKIA